MPTYKNVLLWFGVLLLLFTSSLAGCTVKATIKSTTDAITNVLSSTTGRSWFTEDGMLKQHDRALAFASMNFENLQEDMARGRGEYLESFSALLSVPPEHKQAFFVFTQNHYSQLMASRPLTPVTFIQHLERELALTPELKPLGSLL